MYIMVVKNGGRDYMRLVESYRPVVNGVLGNKTTKLIKSLGFVEDLTDGQPNFVKRVKESFKMGCPILPALEEYCTKEQPIKYTYTVMKGSENCILHSYYYCHKFLERIIEDLNIQAVTGSYKALTKIEYDVYGFLKLLLFGRILNPASKWGTLEQNTDYYDNLLDVNAYKYNVYDVLDFLYKNKKQYLTRIKNTLEKHYPNQSKRIYYDVTNVYFEIEENDPDTEEREGLRKRGVSKEHRDQPITQIGLFMNEWGMPMSYGVFPGNKLDHQTFLSALNDSLDTLPSERTVLVGDRGMFNYENVGAILVSGNGYVISKSLNGTKSDGESKKWAYSDEGYTWLNDEFKYKSKNNRREIKKSDGTKEIIEEKVVVYWSKKIYDRAVHENKTYMEFLNEFLKNPHSFRFTAQHKSIVSKFLKTDMALNIKTGEIIHTDDLKMYIDQDKVDEFTRGFGYYQICTSELEMDDMEVITTYHGLKQIEDLFRVMKSSLDIRPVYVIKPEHIDGHVLLCVMACQIIRLIQRKITDSEGTALTKKCKWTYGMSADKIINALKKWKVVKNPNDTYQFIDIDDPDLQRIFKAFDIKIPLDVYTRQSLKSLKSTFKILD